MMFFLTICLALTTVMAQRTTLMAQRANIIPTPVNFVPVNYISTTSSLGVSGMPIFDGSRISMPTSWQTPTHTFSTNHINHGNGMFSGYKPNGDPINYYRAPGSNGPATCYSFSGNC